MTGDALEPHAATVASPCVNVCRIEERTGLCAGCLRTMDEIALWSMLDDETKRDVLAAVAQRRAGVAGGAGSGGTGER